MSAHGKCNGKGGQDKEILDAGHGENTDCYFKADNQVCPAQMVTKSEGAM